jgi:hypothetical protein
VGFATECRIEYGAARSINAYRNPLPVIERSQTVIHAQPYRAGQARFPAGECRKAKAVRLTQVRELADMEADRIFQGSIPALYDQRLARKCTF